MNDKIDSELVRLLTLDGRMSFLELARKAHLSPNATAERVRKLRRRGIIKGFTAIVDQTALGRPLIVYVDIRVKPGADSLRLEQMLRGLAGAVEHTSVSGNYDYQVKLACADQDDLFKKIVKLRLQPGVQETHTRLIMGETKLSS